MENSTACHSWSFKYDTSAEQDVVFGYQVHESEGDMQWDSTVNMVDSASFVADTPARDWRPWSKTDPNDEAEEDAEDSDEDPGTSKDRTGLLCAIKALKAGMTSGVSLSGEDMTSFTSRWDAFIDTLATDLTKVDDFNYDGMLPPPREAVVVDPAAARAARVTQLRAERLIRVPRQDGPVIHVNNISSGRRDMREARDARLVAEEDEDLAAEGKKRPISGGDVLVLNYEADDDWPWKIALGVVVEVTEDARWDPNGIFRMCWLTDAKAQESNMIQNYSRALEVLRWEPERGSSRSSDKTKVRIPAFKLKDSNDTKGREFHVKTASINRDTVLMNIGQMPFAKATRPHLMKSVRENIVKQLGL
jgi:hypothetical protein